jgi:hypothetical protein
MKGKTHTPETRARIAESRRRAWADQPRAPRAPAAPKLTPHGNRYAKRGPLTPEQRAYRAARTRQSLGCPLSAKDVRVLAARGVLA